jgi:hypothetical protein
VFQGFEITGQRRISLDDDAIGIQIEPRRGDISHVEVRNNLVHDVGPGQLDVDECYYNAHGIIAQAREQLLHRACAMLLGEQPTIEEADRCDREARRSVRAAVFVAREQLLRHRVAVVVREDVHAVDAELAQQALVQRRLIEDGHPASVRCAANSSSSTPRTGRGRGLLRERFNGAAVPGHCRRGGHHRSSAARR